MASCKDFSCGPLDFKLGSDIAFCGMVHKLCNFLVPPFKGDNNKQLGWLCRFNKAV